MQGDILPPPMLRIEAGESLLNSVEGGEFMKLVKRFSIRVWLRKRELLERYGWYPGSGNLADGYPQAGVCYPTRFEGGVSR